MFQDMGSDDLFNSMIECQVFCLVQCLERYSSRGRLDEGTCSSVGLAQAARGNRPQGVCLGDAEQTV